MTYKEARALLDRLPRFEVKPGLERIERLLRAVGLPQAMYPAIHVAGTNGKGSVVAMLDAILRAAGHRVGRYTSPELLDFRDRITVNGRWLSEHEWAAGIRRLAPAITSAEDVPAQFEAITALALDAFARAGVDLAVVEVGLGGRFDATSVVRPILTLLTNVDLDHTALLGDSVEEIAQEKVGIARSGVPFLTGRLQESVEAIVDAECENVGAERVRDAVPALRPGGQGEVGPIYRAEAPDLPACIELALHGSFQQENLALVLGSIRILREKGWTIPNDAVTAGLRTVEWPGRFEIVRRRPLVILDGAHNPSGARALAREAKRLQPDLSKRKLVLGVLADKDVPGIAEALVLSFSEVLAVKSESPRALASESLAEIVQQFGGTVTCYDSLSGALRPRLPAAPDDELWIVAGSLTTVGEARAIVEDLG